MLKSKSFPAKFPGSCTCGCGQRFVVGQTEITRGTEGWVVDGHGQRVQTDYAAVRRAHAQKAQTERVQIRARREAGVTVSMAKVRETVGLEESPLSDTLVDCGSCGCLHRKDIKCPW